MASPVFESVTATAFSSAATSHDVDMPATVDAGDLLLICIVSNGDQTAYTTPSGWSVLDSSLLGNVGRTAVYSKVAVGDEDGTTVDVVSDVSRTAAAHCLRISGWYGSLAGVSSSAFEQLSGSSVNAPSLTVPWGDADNLFISVLFATNDDQAITGFPSGYSGGSYTVSGGGNNNGGEVGTCWKQSTSETDNPSAYTLETTESARAVTIGIRPAGGGPTPSPYPYAITI